MVDNLKNVITDFMKEIAITPSTPAGYHLFKVCPNEEMDILDE